jgi:hypothetical protein
MLPPERIFRGAHVHCQGNKRLRILFVSDSGVEDTGGTNFALEDRTIVCESCFVKETRRPKSDLPN